MTATPRFISDLHFGHKSILNFAGDYREGNTVDEHDDWIVAQWNSTVRKRDPVYVLGDVAFSREGLSRVKELTGEKFLIMGNHDVYAIDAYQEVGFKVVGGFKKYKGFWLSHAPIHPDELRGRYNIHGHVHHNSIKDDRYINVSVEAINGKPISINEIRNLIVG